MDMSLSKLWWWTGKPGCCSPWGSKESDMTEWLNWIPLFLGLPWWLSSKEAACQAADVGLSPEWGWSLEKEMSTHSSVLSWEIPWTDEHGELKSKWLQKCWTNFVTKQHLFFIIHCYLVTKTCLTGLWSHGLACQCPLSTVSQERTLEWVFISFSRGSSQSRDQVLISCLADRFFAIEPLSIHTNL